MHIYSQVSNQNAKKEKEAEIKKMYKEKKRNRVNFFFKGETQERRKIYFNITYVHGGERF